MFLLKKYITYVFKSINLTKNCSILQLIPVFIVVNGVIY